MLKREVAMGVFVVLMLTAALAHAQERRFAVVIGANTGDPGEAELQYAERDAKRVADVLQTMGGVDEKDMAVVLGSNSQTVERVLRSMYDELVAVEPGTSTMLFVYYSGHADPNSIHLGGSKLGFELLRALMEDAPAQIRVLVLDACQTGDFTRVKGGAPAKPFDLEAAQWGQAEGFAVITSAAQGEDAQESDRVQGSYFTHHFISGLHGAADASKDGAVTLTEAYDYAYRETLRATSRARFVQHPTYSFEIAGRRDPVMTRLSELDGSMGRLRLTEVGDYVLFMDDDVGEVVAEVSVRDEADLLLRPGPYFVRRRHDNAVHEGRFEVSAGEWAAVDMDSMKRVAVGRAARKGGGMEGEIQTAWGIVSGGGLSAEILGGTGLLSQGIVGVQLDTDPFTMQLRFRYAQSRGENEFLALQSDLFGGDLTGMTLVDLGPFFLGGGVRIGGDLLVQSFPGSDEASREGFVGRLSAVAVTGWAPTSWLSVFLEPTADAYLLDIASEEGPALRIAPALSAGAVVYF